MHILSGSMLKMFRDFQVFSNTYLHIKNILINYLTQVSDYSLYAPSHLGTKAVQRKKTHISSDHRICTLPAVQPVLFSQHITGPDIMSLGNWEDYKNMSNEALSQVTGAQFEVLSR